MALVAKHVELTIRFTYASSGDTQAIHHKVLSKARALKQDLSQLFTDAAATCDFLGAKELVAASRKQKTYTLQLDFIEQYISQNPSSYVVLCRLTDYYRFIGDEDGHLRRHIFESNVRDYQGDVEVNQDIRRTLANPLSAPVDFWWLNNGITVLCSHASVAGKTLFLDDVQVVNGLQTSREIYEYLGGDGASLQDNRSVLIRVVATDDADTIDLIIKATNRQTAVPSASLRATDEIQRHIEDYFLRAGWFYDRRKNYYKNQGKPSARVVGIPYLAQAVMAIMLREPDNSRARPSTLIKVDEEYRRVFDPQRPLPAYLFCAQMMKEIDKFLRTQIQDRALRIRTGNFRFHLAMLMIAQMLQRLEYRPENVEQLVSDRGFGTQADLNVPDSPLTSCAAALLGAVDAYVDKTKFSEDKAAKSSEFPGALAGNAGIRNAMGLNARPDGA